MHSDYDAFMCINVHKFVFQFTEKTFLQEMRKLRKKEKEGKPLTKRQQEVEDLDLTNQSWEKIFVFKGHDDNSEAARQGRPLQRR